jgi:hypothetical protein
MPSFFFHFFDIHSVASAAHEPHFCTRGRSGRFLSVATTVWSWGFYSLRIGFYNNYPLIGTARAGMGLEVG